MNRPAHLGRTPAIAGLVLLTLGLTLAVVLAGSHQKPPPKQPPSALSPETTYAAASTDVHDAVDPWGVQKLYPTREGGMVWYSNWRYGIDDWTYRENTGATYETDPSTGVLTATGTIVRMYVRDPQEKRQWLGGVEVTVYALRPTGTTGTPYSGIVTGVRTNHGTVGNVDIDPCDTRTYYARLRFDGYTDFGKETKHPNLIPWDARKLFPHGMPYNQWFGYKHVVYDTKSAVVQQLYVDLPGGGQHWQLANETTDDGTSWGKGAPACAEGIDPAMELRGGTTREGSESGLPNIAVEFRADNVMEGMEYKQASVREIEEPPRL